MAEISKITLPNGVTYSIKDEVARAAAAAGLTINVVDALPIPSKDTLGAIYLISHTHSAGMGGDAVLDNDTNHNAGDVLDDSYDEYITVLSDGSYKWEKIGNTDVDLTGYSKTGHTHSVTSNVTVGAHTYTPAGGVTSTFSGTEGTVSVSGTLPTTNVTISTGTGTANYTPAGSMSGITWGGSATTFSGKYTPSGSMSGITWGGSNTTFSGKYTPEGTVTTPTISVKNSGGTAVTLYSMSSAGSKTNGSYTGSSFTAGTTAHTFAVADETLTIGTGTADSYTKESVTLPTVTLPDRTAVTVSASQPTFTGTEKSVSTSGTPLGSITSQGTFTGTEKSVSTSGTPLGSITSQGTFTGTGVQLKGTSGTETKSLSGKFTPAGGVTSTFTGTQASIAHTGLVTNNAVTSGTNSK